MNITKEYIFETDKYFNACHASTVLKLPDGDMLAAWFGGTAEGNDDVRIWYSRKTDGKWSAPEELKTNKNMPHWNPVLFLKNDGTVRLFFKTGRKISHWVTEYCDSKDGGKTWSEAKNLNGAFAVGGRGPVKNKCIRRKDGTVLAPASSEQGGWRCFVDISEDDGETWTMSPYIVRQKIPGKGLIKMIQPTLWEDDRGVVHALMRSDTGAVLYSSSKNLKKWSTPEKTPIPNNNSGIDCVKAEDGNIYLVCNPVGDNWGARSPLVLMKSEKNGEDFSTVAVLEDREGGEFSYPAIISDGDELHITYTYDRKNIVYCNVKL